MASELPKKDAACSDLNSAADLDHSDKSSLNSSSQKLVMKPLKCVMLDGDNYFSWRAQFPVYSKDTSYSNMWKGRWFILWTLAEQKDQLILSWILMAVSPSILPQVAALTMSAEVWESLHQLFASASET